METTKVNQRAIELVLNHLKSELEEHIKSNWERKYSFSTSICLMSEKGIATTIDVDITINAKLFNRFITDYMEDNE